jgi:membrane-bound metal-dependent hydrolase YbcI (DUF457 family)
MPGLLPHLFAGISLYCIGRLYFKKYFINNPNDNYLLFLICLLFSIIPDLFLGIYYTTHVLSFNTLKEYHNMTHYLFSPIAFILLIIAICWRGLSKRPIWIMGLFAIGIHILMDIFIDEFGVLI